VQASLIEAMIFLLDFQAALWTLTLAAQFITVCSSSILMETLGYAGAFSSPLHGKRRVFERCKPIPYGSTATIYKV
jgi:hypothetical protein